LFIRTFGQARYDELVEQYTQQKADEQRKKDEKQKQKEMQ